MSHTPDLPDELWLHIISHLRVSHLDDFDPTVASHITIDDEDKALSDSAQAKSALRCVSRRFSSLVKPFSLEIVRIRSLITLQSLASTLRERNGLGLESLFHETTRRLDIIVLDDSNTVSVLPTESQASALVDASVPEKLLNDILTVLYACDSLTFLVCRLPWNLMGLKSRSFTEALIRLSSLRVLRLHCPMALDLAALLSKLPALRVWDLSVMCPYMCTDNLATEFPNVHTISGPLHILCPAFVNSCFPSLRRLVCQFIPRRNTPAFVSFLMKHGHRIRSLELRCIIDQGQEIVAACPNLAHLVIHYEYADLLSIELFNLETIGIMGNVIPNISTTQMLLYIFGLLEDRLEKDQLPKLRKVWILDFNFVKYLLKNNMNVLKLYDRRFRSRMVDLEDAHGNKLMVPS